MRIYHWVFLLAIFYAGMVVAAKKPGFVSMATGGLVKAA